MNWWDTLIDGAGSWLGDLFSSGGSGGNVPSSSSSSSGFLSDLFSGDNLATLAASGLGAWSQIGQADAVLGDKEADRQFQREMLAQEMAFKREMAAKAGGEGGAARALQAEIARRQLTAKAYESLMSAALAKGGMLGGALDSLTSSSQNALLSRR